MQERQYETKPAHYRYGLICILVHQNYQIEITTPYLFRTYEEAINTDIQVLFKKKLFECSAGCHKFIVQANEWWKYRIMQLSLSSMDKTELNEDDYRPTSYLANQLPFSFRELPCIGLIVTTIQERSQERSSNGRK